MTEANAFGQPIGESLGDWSPPPPPPHVDLPGRYVNLEPLGSSHVDDLYRNLAGAPDSLWTYMTFGPFASKEGLAATVDDLIASPGWYPYGILVDEEVRGFASYLRVDPPAGTLEIGSIVLSPPLQRTREGTEALFLMIEHTFASGYRRCEWKCDDLNEPSRVAALRLGFRYEGTFRQATHYKGRNRDTAWYAIVDKEWPVIRSAFQAWLAPENFDDEGRQLKRLSHLTESVVDG